jgi:hypothetical protein
MSHTLARAVLAAGVLAASAGLTATDSAAQGQGGLATYRNERHGFTVSYPAAQFIALPAATEDARLFVSNDDKARLLVGTLDNTDNKTVAQYQQFLLRESYAGAAVDYAPLRDKVVRAVGRAQRHGLLPARHVQLRRPQDQQLGLLFPEAEKATYEPIIEQVHRSYSVSDRNCG